jgi:hypothetical protein
MPGAQQQHQQQQCGTELAADVGGWAGYGSVA